jgi:hypothetical protein
VRGKGRGKEAEGPRTSTKFVNLLSRAVINLCTSFSIFRFAASSTDTYHLLSRVRPCLFCSRKNLIVIYRGVCARVCAGALFWFLFLSFLSSSSVS